MARSLDVIGDAWSMLIVRDAFDGLRRFGEFQQSLGIAKGVLTSRLRDLCNHGIFFTQDAEDGSAYHDYVLTKKGRDLFLLIVALRQWGETHLYRRGEPRSTMVELKSGEAVPRLELRATDGRVLDADATRVSKVDNALSRPKKTKSMKRLVVSIQDIDTRVR